MCWVLCSTGARDAKKTCREASDLSIITRQSDGTVRDPPCAPSCLWQLTACCVSSPHAILETTTRGQACGRLLLPSPPPHPQKGYSPHWLALQELGIIVTKTSYIIFGRAHCQIKMQIPWFKIILRISEQQRQSIQSTAEPKRDQLHTLHTHEACPDSTQAPPSLN